MTYTFDFEADAAYIKFSDLPHHYSREIDQARFVDYTEDGSVIGVELLYVSGGVDVDGLPESEQIAALLREHDIKIVGVPVKSDTTEGE